MNFPAHVSSLVGQLSLRETAEVMASAGVVVGNDSGLSHIAAAVGTPTVMLFGPTPHESLGPMSPNVKMLRSGLAVRTLLVSQSLPGLRWEDRLSRRAPRRVCHPRSFLLPILKSAGQLTYPHRQSTLARVVLSLMAASLEDLFFLRTSSPMDGGQSSPFWRNLALPPYRLAETLLNMQPLKLFPRTGQEIRRNVRLISRHLSVYFSLGGMNRCIGKLAIPSGTV